MSDLQNVIRQFGDKVAQVENQTASHLGEIRTGVRDTAEDVRRRTMTALAKIEQGKKMVEEGTAEIAAILDDADRAALSIGAEIAKVIDVKLSPTGKFKAIAGGRENKEEANG